MPLIFGLGPRTSKNCDQFRLNKMGKWFSVIASCPTHILINDLCDFLSLLMKQYILLRLAGFNLCTHHELFLEKVIFHDFSFFLVPDSINIKILNAGAWARGSERVTVSLPLELEDYIPEVEDFYKKKHSGRKLQWYHHMSNGTVS